MSKLIGFTGILLLLCFIESCTGFMVLTHPNPLLLASARRSRRYTGDGRTNCAITAMTSCYKRMALGLSPPHNAAKLEQYCRRLPAAKSCLEELECKKDTSQYIIWMSTLGLAEAFIAMCNSNEMRRVYLERGQCMENAMTTGDGLRCYSSAFQSVASLLKSSSDSSTLDLPSSERIKICRSSEESIACARTVLKSRCGEDAARLLVKNSENANKRLHAYLKCEIDLSYLRNGGNRTSSSVTSSVMLFILLLMLGHQ